jgi:hypothetical protein
MELSKNSLEKNNQIKTGHKLQSIIWAAYPPSVPFFCLAAPQKDSTQFRLW